MVMRYGLRVIIIFLNIWSVVRFCDVVLLNNDREYGYFFCCLFIMYFNVLILN